MSSYVFPVRDKGYSEYLSRVFRIYGLVSICAGILTFVMVVGIVHPVFTVLVLVCLGLGLVVGQASLRPKLDELSALAARKQDDIERFERKHRELTEMYVARQFELQHLSAEIDRLTDELAAAQSNKKRA